MAVLLDNGAASVDDLSTRFGVSKMTIHRDLDELESGGLLRKVRGGASIEASAQFESDFRYRQTQSASEKDHLAAAAAAMIEPGQTVIVDDSSTAACLVRHLTQVPLTIVTNGLTVITDLAGSTTTNLIALGGQYNKKFNGFFGLACDEALRSIRVDIAFLSSSAIHGVSAFHQHQEVVQAKRLMIESAEQCHLLVDHTKFGRSALHFVAELSTFDSVMTGCAPAAEHRGLLEDAEVKLRVLEGFSKESS